MIVLQLRREDLGLDDRPSVRHTDLGLGGGEGGQTTTTTRVEIFSQAFFFSNETNNIYPAHNLQNHGFFFLDSQKSRVSTWMDDGWVLLF